MKTFALSVALFAITLPGFAGESWDAVRAQLYDTRPLKDGTDVIAIDAPYRTPDDGRTDLAAQVVAPNGLNIGQVTLVLDENPMPVSAVFDLNMPLPSFYFDVTMRVNGPTPVHVIAETTDGQLWVAETYVKTSGLGACAAPPGTDPEEALASLGQMEIEMSAGLPGGAAGSTLQSLRQSQLDVHVSHPSHSGMQMDQISLLFLPMRYVENVEIDLDGAGYVDLTGSISLSENPRVGMSVPSSTRSVDVTMTDTDGTVSHAHKKLGGY